MADVTGARGTGNILQAVRKVDMAEEILLLEPDAAPLVVLSSRSGDQPAHNPKYSWVEDALAVRFDTTTATSSTTDTTIDVTNGTLFEANGLVKVPRTGEVMRVVSIATNVVTVVRAVGAGFVTGVALNSGEELLIIGSAQPEGDTSKPARSNNPAEKVNYTQITRTPFESTGTLRASATFTNPTDWAYNAKKAGIEHAKSLEYTYWMGKPSEDTSGSQPRRTTGGVFHFLTTNLTDAGGQLTETEFNGALRGAFRYGPKRKIAFGSQLALGVLNGYALGKVRAIQADRDTTYGLNVSEYVTTDGTLHVITHYLFEGATYGGYLVILDMSQVKKRHLQSPDENRNTHIRDNIQAPDADTMKSEYLSETGLQFGLEKTHALIYGITS